MPDSDTELILTKPKRKRPTKPPANPNFNPSLPVSRANPIVDLERAINLRLKGLTYLEIAQIFGVTQTTVHERLQGYIPEDSNLSAFKLNRADIMAAKQEQILKSLSQDDIQKASAYQRVGMYGILYDKERLERGQSTANVAYADLSREMRDIDNEIRQLEEELGSSVDVKE